MTFTDDPYLRIYGKGDKERIVAITDTTADHMRNYLKAYHPTKDPDSPLILTVIKGRKDRMSVGNVCVFRLNGTACTLQREGCPLQTGSF